MVLDYKNFATNCYTEMNRLFIIVVEKSPVHCTSNFTFHCQNQLINDLPSVYFCF